MKKPEQQSWTPSANERVLDLAEMIRGCFNFGNNFREQQGIPQTGAPARAAMGEPFGESVLSAVDFASSNLLVVEDLMHGFAALLGPPPETAFAPQILLRAALETAARAWHLADPESNPRVVAGRAINERIHNAKQNAAMARNPSPDPEKAKKAVDEALEQLDRYFTTAQDEGLTVVADKQGNPIWVEEHRPSATSVVTMAWEHEGEGLGDFLYRYYSAASHARPTAFRQSIIMDQDEEGRLRGNTFVSLPAIEMWARILVTAWQNAFDRVVSFSGWDDEMWSSWRRNSDRVLAGITIRFR